MNKRLMKNLVGVKFKLVMKYMIRLKMIIWKIKIGRLMRVWVRLIVDG